MSGRGPKSKKHNKTKRTKQTRINKYFKPVHANNMMASLMAQMEGMALEARGANGAAAGAVSKRVTRKTKHSKAPRIGATTGFAPLSPRAKLQAKLKHFLKKLQELVNRYDRAESQFRADYYGLLLLEYATALQTLFDPEAPTIDGAPESLTGDIVNPSVYVKAAINFLTRIHSRLPEEALEPTVEVLEEKTNELKADRAAIRAIIQQAAQNAPAAAGPPAAANQNAAVTELEDLLKGMGLGR